MDLSTYVSTIASSFDRNAGMDSPAMLLLRGAPKHLAEHLPAGVFVRGSGGVGRGTMTPWFGIFDPDETTSPQDGLYVVYLFAADLQTILAQPEPRSHAARARSGEPSRSRRADSARDCYQGAPRGRGRWSESRHEPQQPGLAPDRVPGRQRRLHDLRPRESAAGTANARRPRSVLGAVPARR